MFSSGFKLLRAVESSRCRGNMFLQLWLFNSDRARDNCLRDSRLYWNDRLPLEDDVVYRWHRVLSSQS